MAPIDHVSYKLFESGRNDYKNLALYGLLVVIIFSWKLLTVVVIRLQVRDFKRKIFAWHILEISAELKYVQNFVNFDR